MTVAVVVAVLATCVMLWVVSRRWRRPGRCDFTMAQPMYEVGDVLRMDGFPEPVTVTAVHRVGGRAGQQITTTWPVPWPWWWRLAVAMAPLTLLPLAGWLA